MIDNKFLFCVISIFILFLPGCSQPPGSATLIPEETIALVTLNLSEIIQKGGLEELVDDLLDELPVPKDAEKLYQENKALLFESIDIKSNVYIYGFIESNFLYVCFSADMRNKSNVEKLLDLADDNNLPVPRIKKEGDYNIISIAEGGQAFGMAWDDDKLLMIMGNELGRRSTRITEKDIENQIEDLFTLKEEKNITSVDQFNNFYSEKGDIAIWYQAGPILEFVEDMMGPMLDNLPVNFDFDDLDNLKDTSASLNLSFNDDGVSLYFITYLNDETNDQMKKIYDADFESDILEYLPKKSLAAGGGVINVKEIYSYMETQIENFADDEFRNFKKQLKRETGLKLDDFVESISGSFAVSLSGIEEIEYERSYYDRYSRSYKNKTVSEPFPLVTFSMNHKGTGLIKDIVDLMEDGGAPIKKKRGYYTLKDKYDPPFYFAFNDEALVITTDKSVIKTFGDGGPDDNLLNTDYGRGIKNNNIYGSINLDLDKWLENMPEDIKTEIDKDLRPLPLGTLEDLNEIISFVEIKVSYNRVSFDLVMDTDGENSLSAIINFIKKKALRLLSSVDVLEMEAYKCDNPNCDRIHYRSVINKI